MSEIDVDLKRIRYNLFENAISKILSFNGDLYYFICSCGFTPYSSNGSYLPDVLIAEQRDIMRYLEYINVEDLPRLYSLNYVLVNLKCICREFIKKHNYDLTEEKRNEFIKLVNKYDNLVLFSQ